MVVMSEKDLKEEIKTIREQLDRITLGLFGDPDMKTEGLAGKVDRHDKILALLDKLKWKGIGFIAAFSLLIGLFGQSIAKILMHILKL
jgi:hypothetical protein